MTSAKRHRGYELSYITSKKIENAVIRIKMKKVEKTKQKIKTKHTSGHQHNQDYKNNEM